MSVFDRSGILMALFGGNGSAVKDMAQRWQRAFDRDPELAADLVRLGGVVVPQPLQFENGSLIGPARPDPYVLAMEAGKRDLALAVLALGQITETELLAMMESSHDL